MPVNPRYLEGLLAYKFLPGDRLAAVVPLTFDRARLCVTPPGGDGSFYQWSY